MWNVTFRSEWYFVTIVYINRRIDWTSVVKGLGRILDNIESTNKVEEGTLTF